MTNLGNVLEDVTLKVHPEVALIKDQMKRFGADAVLMSGSGPTVFGLFSMILECKECITD